MKRSKTRLDKGDKGRLLAYLILLEQSLPKPVPILSISERTQKRLAQKYRNYRHAISVIRSLVDPVNSEPVSFRKTKQYDYHGEAIHVHLKSRKRGLRKVSQCEQPTEAQSISA